MLINQICLAFITTCEDGYQPPKQASSFYEIQTCVHKNIKTFIFVPLTIHSCTNHYPVPHALLCNIAQSGLHDCKSLNENMIKAMFRNIQFANFVLKVIQCRYLINKQIKDIAS